jgi:NADH-quinone oxidoreductase subunit M
MGFVALGLASGSRTGLQAALFANVAHGIVSALLFFIVGGLKERWDTSDLAVAHDALREVSPRLGFALITGLAASLGLPGLAGFWGEFLGVYAVWSPSGTGPLAVFRTAAVAGAVGAVLSAGYALRVARLVWVGDRPAPMAAAAAHPPEEPAAGGEGSRDMVGSERAVITAFTTAALALGVLPGPLLAVTASTVRILLGGR